MRNIYRFILLTATVLGSFFQMKPGVRMVDRFLILTQKEESIKHIFHITPDLKIKFEGEDIIIKDDSVTTRIPRKDIAGYEHLGRSSLTLNVVADNEDATPLPDAKVRLIASSSGTECAQLTGNEGTLRFKEITPDYYNLAISGLPLFADYESESPFLHIEDSEMTVILKETIRKPELTSFEIINSRSDLYDLQISWTIDNGETEEDFGYTFYISLDGNTFSPINHTTFELFGIAHGEHLLTIKGVSPYGKESELYEHLFKLESPTTGIDHINSSISGETELYDLNGKTVTPSIESKGIYIMPGEKKNGKIIIR